MTKSMDYRFLIKIDHVREAQFLPRKTNVRKAAL